MYNEYNEVLILVDEKAMDEYRGSLEDIKKSYTKWGFKLDEKYDTMIFRADLNVLGNFKDFHMEYFDEKQALGKEFLFIIRDSIDDILKDELNQFPIFNYGFWTIYDIPAYILLIHRNSLEHNDDIILKKYKAKRMFKSSYLLSKDSFELINKEYEEKEKFTIFKCYPIGGEISIDTWKERFYNQV